MLATATENHLVAKETKPSSVLELLFFTQSPTSTTFRNKVFADVEISAEREDVGTNFT